jgi:hypothetical protein
MFRLTGAGTLSAARTVRSASSSCAGDNRSKPISLFAFPELRRVQEIQSHF